MNLPTLQPSLSKVRTSLAKLRAADSDIVLFPGYTTDGQQGYFICNEQHLADGNPHDDYFTYQVLGYEQSYQAAVNQFKHICSVASG